MRAMAVSVLLASCLVGPPSSKPTAPTPPTLPEATSFRLTDNVRPLAYELRLTIDPETRSFGGRVNIRVAVATATRHVVLHARELTTTSVSIDGERADAVVRGMRGGEEPNELILAPADELEPGEHTIRKSPTTQATARTCTDCTAVSATARSGR